MKKRFIASVICCTTLASSIALASPVASIKSLDKVDVVAAATSWTPEPAKPAPAKPAPAKPAPAKPAPSTSTPTQAKPVSLETAADIHRLLAFGSVGEDVSLVQTLLNKFGYNLKADSIYGKRTQAAVKDFQAKNGLRADGIVGPRTLAVLAPVEEAKPAPAPVEEVKPEEKPVEKPEEKEEKPEEKPEEKEETDATTSASIVTNAEDLAKAMSKDGQWIIFTLNDIVSEKDLVLDGDFLNKRDQVQRKLAPYTQDDNKVVIDRFTITAPKLTINSPNARIQAGKFVGDIYVNAKDFKLVDASVEGNIYFLNQEAKDTFEMDEKSSLKGKRILMADDIDTVASASLVADEAAFEKAIKKEEEGGTWIASLLMDMTFNKPLTVEGDFVYKENVQRKIALYTQDSERNTTRKFTLTVPKFNIKSPNTSIQKGIFNGDIYVESEGFKLVDTKVNGNVYFLTKEAMDSFVKDDKSEVTGSIELFELDAVTSASIVNDDKDLVKASSKHGNWIILLKDDITTDKEVVIEGEFRNGKFDNMGLHRFDRKLALYDYAAAGSKDIGPTYTLKTPKLTVKTPNARIQEGKIIGDVYIDAPGVKIVNTKIEGNLYFTKEEYKESFIEENEFSVSGVREVLK